MIQLQNLMEWMEENSPSKDGFFDRQVVALLLAALILFSGYTLFDSEDVETRYFIDNSTELEFIEDNQLGSMMIRNRAGHPVIYSTESLKACIYISSGEAPIITEINEERNIFLRSKEIRSTSLNLTLGEDELSRDGLTQEMSVEKMERCPVRSEPRIILTEEKR